MDYYGNGKRNNYMDEYGDYCMRIDLPSFNGHMHIETFLDWISEVEKYFDYMNTPEVKKVKLVALRLKGTSDS